MHGVSKEYCNACIKALLSANLALTQMTFEEAFQKPPYGKTDTYNLDAIPEIIIKDVLTDFDKNAILITEELGIEAVKQWPIYSDPDTYPTVFIADPTDRSYYLLHYLESLKNYHRTKIGEVVGNKKYLEKWGKIGGTPPSITGSFSSITCIRRGSVIFSVLLNYITQELTIACESGINIIPLNNHKNNNSHITFQEIINSGEKINFPLFPVNTPWDNYKYFATFLGKTRYKENFDDSKIFVEEKKEGFLHHEEPGGPSRILYLSSLQNKNQPIGFILSNGEKIIEWIHWLPFVKYAKNKGKKSFKIFEIFHPRPWTKAGVLMAPSKIYSIFQDFNGKIYLDIGYLKRFPNPSKYRSTLVVTRRDNEWISSGMKRYNYRELTL